MAKPKGGLTEWFKQDWVDIGAPKKGGGYAKCGRSKLEKDRKRKYPKCVPAAKAARMSKSQIKSAVRQLRIQAMQDEQVGRLTPREEITLSPEAQKAMASAGS